MHGTFLLPSTSQHTGDMLCRSSMTENFMYQASESLASKSEINYVFLFPTKNNKRTMWGELSETNECVVGLWSSDTILKLI